MITPEQEQMLRSLATDTPEKESVHVRAGLLAKVLDSLAAERQSRERAEKERDAWREMAGRLYAVVFDLWLGEPLDNTDYVKPDPNAAMKEYDAMKKGEEVQS